MDTLTYLKSQNAEYIEELYERYLKDPYSVDDSWRFFFDGLTASRPTGSLTIGAPPPSVASSANNGGSGAKVYTLPTAGAVSTEAKVSELIQHYREMGRLLADINPLEKPPLSHPLLSLATFDLTPADLDQKFTAAKLIGFPTAVTLQEIIQRLKETYCGTIGVEFTHIHDPAQREWLQNCMESTHNKPQLSKDTKKHILKKLTEAESFERFLHARFVGQKRFSIEGADSLIPMLDCMIVDLAEMGAVDVVMGMAHRGRLNVLTNIFGKNYEHVFREFEGVTGVSAGEGDVKYHMGYSHDFVTPSGKSIHLSLTANPSHLEFVNPVVEGAARAKQRMKQDYTRSKVIPILIHGDAAFAGQGIVYETIQLSLLNGYATGGTIHIVTNNQIGFTTLPRDSRSTTYSTDLAKMLETPIFHVNGDDPEACYFVSQLSLRFRQQFHRDVVIDQICYRKYGHNEGDEPAFTQPLMYKTIKGHPSVRELYVKKLLAEGSVTESEVQTIQSDVTERLNKSFEILKSDKVSHEVSVFQSQWKGFRHASEDDFKKAIDTSVNTETLLEIGKKIYTVPQNFTPHAKMVRLIEVRRNQVESGKGIEWGTAEALCYGSCLIEGAHVRLSGQDCERGTFSHRHSVWYDYENGKQYVPLNHIREGQADYSVYNSSLSESAVLGFEYGYSLAFPNSITIWEAQFGDFVNGAQVIIDQFIVASESKWQRMCGLILLLPHGYEGQGPEHSSARLERFLQLCARQNIQVCNFTTPAQFFHGVRRQIKREFRKPLIVMSPKSLLRHHLAVSTLDDLAKGHFQEVIDDSVADPKTISRLIFCTGKIYYELFEGCKKLNSKNAIIRVEQLYPWPGHQLTNIVKRYSGVKDICWVQEEARNMGAWNAIHDHLTESLREALGSGFTLRYIGRPPAAAPAVGSNKLHAKEQLAIIEEACK